jgi:hypothetical protein
MILSLDKPKGDRLDLLLHDAAELQLSTPGSFKQHTVQETTKANPSK